LGIELERAREVDRSYDCDERGNRTRDNDSNTSDDFIRRSLSHTLKACRSQMWIVAHGYRVLDNVPVFSVMTIRSTMII